MQNKLRGLAESMYSLTMFTVANMRKDYRDAPVVNSMIGAGIDVLRYNLSYGTPEETREKIAIAREVIAKSARDVKILADLPGNKIRLGKLFNDTFKVTKGQEVVFKSGTEAVDGSYVPVNFPKIGRFVKTGDVVTSKDGELAFMVAAVDEDGFCGTALTSYEMISGKGFNCGRAIDELDHMTEQTVVQMRAIAEAEPDMVAFSFVNDKEKLKRAKERLAQFAHPAWKPVIVAKIESPLGVENISSIVDECDMIMVARGDLGLQCDFRMLGLYQKNITKAVGAKGKKVIVATQILDSLLSNFIPSRADILDLTNIVMDGADGIMFSATSSANDPAMLIKTAREIISAVSDGNPSPIGTNS